MLRPAVTGFFRVTPARAYYFRGVFGGVDKVGTRPRGYLSFSVALIASVYVVQVCGIRMKVLEYTFELHTFWSPTLILP